MLKPIILAIAAIAPTLTYAWGIETHQLIATLAQTQLTPAAQQKINDLLALEPGATLASISTWPDEHRNPQTSAWHYVNFPRDDCHYVAERDCPDGKCVVSAVDQKLKVFNSNVDPAKQLEALKYIVHFVGDVHQPLHAGYQDDKGGNTYQLQAFMRGTNLHAVWDSGLLRAMKASDMMSQDKLSLRVRDSKSTPWTPAMAAEESCAIVSTEGFYPGRLVDMDYVRKWAPIFEDRVVLASVRLAEMLNR